MRQATTKLLLLAALALGPGCSDDDNGPGADGGLDGATVADAAADAGTNELDISVCDPVTGGPFTLDIDNPYFPLQPGTHLTLEGTEGSTLVRVEFVVTDATEVVAGVTCRVVEERESEDGTLVEISSNYFVQALGGTVCYYGEAVDIYEGGVVVGHEGAWRADESGNQPGIFMPADPQVGMTFRQEVAPGVAMDQGEITAMGNSYTVPAGTYTDTVWVLDTSPLDSGSSVKIYARDVGMIKDDAVELLP